MAADPEVGPPADAITDDDASGPSSQRTRRLTSKARENEANRDLYDDESITVGKKTAKRSGRSAAAKTTPSGDGKNTALGDDVVEEGRMVEMIGILCKEVKYLRDVVIKQQDTIKDLRDRHEETHSELQKSTSSSHAPTPPTGTRAPSPWC